MVWSHGVLVVVFERFGFHVQDSVRMAGDNTSAGMHPPQGDGAAVKVAGVAPASGMVFPLEQKAARTFSRDGCIASPALFTGGSERISIRRCGPSSVWRRRAGPATPPTMRYMEGAADFLQKK
jgi:hypothetical protein